MKKLVFISILTLLGKICSAQYANKIIKSDFDYLYNSDLYIGRIFGDPFLKQPSCLKYVQKESKLNHVKVYET